ncbi:DHA2 family efflux MFS transporter permease subunit [Metabacillus malikii]|uniref:DHA2 family lincomycin resistance protein-like MFS transporter n=1 Tax=Metabacillus malikii TaxID=1504265 RepID=A0ABT9ZNR9_9BACI|nr:DHA2 family efflux MFS transporter permease subunit [Metabacillus malikii]MDQ0233554.1 DHA2 family lincomycin resistance protein-like MFS transporter [Metabacillus malikii]
MDVSVSASAAESQSTGKTYKVVPILVAFLISGFIGLFSETALNIAITELIQVFQTNAATIQWLTTGYLLTLGILVPVSGLLLQWFTTRQLFITSLCLSIIGTLIAALAPSFEILMIARVFQAMGTALLLPLMFNTILVIIPPEKRGGAMGMIGLVIMFAPAVGPTFSGFVLENLTWNWIFWLSLPFLVIGLLAGIFFLENVSEVTKPKIDILSIILSTIGFGGIVFGFSSAGEGSGGWSNPEVIAFIAAGAISLLLFSIRQFKMEHPMINLRAFRYPMFTIGLILVFICMMVILSSMLLLPMYLQRGLVVSAVIAGLVLLPGGILNGLLSPVMGRLFDKYGPKWLVIPGLVIVSVVLWFFSTITTETSIALIVTLHIALMIGVSMVMMPAQTNGLNQLPPQYYPDGTAIMNTLQQVSGAIGTAVAVSILSAGENRYLQSVSNPDDPSHGPVAFTAGVQDGFIFALIAAVIALIVAFFIKRVKVSS